MNPDFCLKLNQFKTRNVFKKDWSEDWKKCQIVFVFRCIVFFIYKVKKSQFQHNWLRFSKWLSSKKSWYRNSFTNQDWINLLLHVIYNPAKLARTLLKIIHVAHMKSYLVIICPNSYENLTKSEIRSSWSRFKHCSESLAHMKYYFVINCPNSYEKLTKSEIRSSWKRFEHYSKSLV